MRASASLQRHTHVCLQLPNIQQPHVSGVPLTILLPDAQSSFIEALAFGIEMDIRLDRHNMFQEDEALHPIHEKAQALNLHFSFLENQA